jgi:hypothetical protein
LQELPNIITGIIDNAFAEQALVQANTYVGQIKDLSQDKPTYVANLAKIGNLVDSLETAINEIWAFTNGGVMGATLTCCATAVWAQTKSRLLLDPATNPSNFTVKDMAFYKTTKQFYQSMMAGLIQQNFSATNAYADIPNTSKPASWLFASTTNGFSLNKFVSVIPCAFQLYTLDANLSSTELLGAAKVMILDQINCSSSPVSLALPSQYSWVDATNVQAAANAWPGVLAIRTQYEKLFSYVSNSAQAFILINQALA